MLDIIGFVFIIVFTIFAYKTAKDYERNAVGWALITFAVGIVIQIVLPVFIILFVFIIAAVSGSSPQKIQEEIPVININVVFKLLSLVAGFLILRHLAKIPEDKPFDTLPQPLKTFDWIL